MREEGFVNIPSWLEPILHIGLWVCRPKYLVGVFPICIDDDGRVLLIKKRLGASTGWQLPGGGKAYGTSFEVTACLELKEETGLVADIKSLRFVTLQCVEKYRDINVAYLVTRYSGTITPEDVTEIEEARWMSFKDACAVLYEPHQALLKQAIAWWYHNGKSYPW